MSPADVATVARRAEVKHVVLKHLVVDDWSDDPAICDKMAEHVRAQFGGEVTVGTDGLMIEVHASA
jgi:ribonuclease BN (tRNA processing enzyme)